MPKILIIEDGQKNDERTALIKDSIARESFALGVALASGNEEGFKMLIPYIKDFSSGKYNSKLISLKAKLRKDQIADLIRLYLDTYYNAGHNVLEYPKDILYIIECIYEYRVPIKLDNIRVEFIYENIYEILSSN